MIELRAIFKGKVQGVGFRWTVVDIAERLKIRGTVKNLPNNTVEVVAHGTKEALENFIEEIKLDCGAAKIEKVEAKYTEPKCTFSDFRIA